MPFIRRDLCFVAFFLSAWFFCISTCFGQAHWSGEARIDSRSVWKPSPVAVQLLRNASLAKNKTLQILIEVMSKDNATAESIHFASIFSKEGAYLSAIDPDVQGDGYTEGEVQFPFRSVGQRTFVLLNGQPRVIDLSDPNLYKNVDINSSKDFTRLWGKKRMVECAWDEPEEYVRQVGANGTQVEVTFPIRDTNTKNIIGYAHFILPFDFYPKGRKVLPAKLEYISIDKY